MRVAPRGLLPPQEARRVDKRVAGGGHGGAQVGEEDAEDNGDREIDILVKSDQESSAQYLVSEVVERRAVGKTLVEESPVTRSGGNGVFTVSNENGWGQFPAD